MTDHSEPKPQWWHISSRLKDGSCCGSLRAWNTDQCIDGRNPQLGTTKVSTYTCDLDSGVEAVLQPSDDGETFLLTIGRNRDFHYCITREEDSTLKIADCKTASKWRKRNGFTPIEYELLSSQTKLNWEKVSDVQRWWADFAAYSIQRLVIPNHSLQSNRSMLRSLTIFRLSKS